MKPGPPKDRTKPVWQAAKMVMETGCSLKEAAFAHGIKSTGAVSKYITILEDEGR